MLLISLFGLLILRRGRDEIGVPWPVPFLALFWQYLSSHPQNCSPWISEVDPPNINHPVHHNFIRTKPFINLPRKERRNLLRNLHRQLLELLQEVPRSRRYMRSKPKHLQQWHKHRMKSRTQQDRSGRVLWHKQNQSQTQQDRSERPRCLWQQNKRKSRIKRDRSGRT